MYKLAPSILAADFNRLGEQLKEMENAGADWVHFDVMDGKFVPSISFGMPVLSSIRSTTKCPFDVHLMIEEPIRYVEEFVKSGADIVTVHAEACSDLEATLKKIKACGAKAGVSVKPATPVEEIKDVLPLVDMVLIMTVEPGFGGQAFIESSYEKIRKMKEMIENSELAIDIEVDGGINLYNIEKVIESGANIFVAGTSVFGGNIAKNVADFKEVFDGC
ncbi:MAG: ribulose-phosphate 3-epimerase [Lachnospiraceae bacterium]|nr:ribulose-phosphate 3-epimerase [Lachnospiraceae bacterium]